MKRRSLILAAVSVAGIGAASAEAAGCPEVGCTLVQDAYISHYAGLNCTGQESYYTPYFFYDGVRRSWDGRGFTGTVLRTETKRSWRGANGVCTNQWPSGHTLSDFVRVYRESTIRSLGGAYISHFTGAGCTGQESYFTPYNGYDGIRRSWDGSGFAGDILYTATVKSWKNAAGTCNDEWPSGHTLSDFVRIYR